MRWGLRDEYPVYDYPWFYHDSDHEVTAVKCGKYMKGSHVDYHTKKECTINSTTKLPTRTCYFQTGQRCWCRSITHVLSQCHRGELIFVLCKCRNKCQVISSYKNGCLLLQAVKLTHVLMHHTSCYHFPFLPISSFRPPLYILLCLTYIPIYAVLPIQPGYPLPLFLRRGCFITSDLFALVGNKN